MSINFWEPYIYILFAFFFLNIAILLSDFRRKIIPNRYLLILLGFLPFFLFYTDTGIGHIFSLDWVIGVTTALCIGIGIFILHGWAPGDAKYFIVLSFFLAGSYDVIRFIGNISSIAAIGVISMTIWHSMAHKKIPSSGKDISGKKRKTEVNFISKEKVFISLFFLTSFVGSYLLVIFFREYIFGKQAFFEANGTNAAIVLFLGILLMRLMQSKFGTPQKKFSGVNILLLCISILPILYGIFAKGAAILYYLRDIGLYGVPTMLMANFLIVILANTLRQQEHETVDYENLTSKDVPVYILIHKGKIRVNTKEDIESICESERQVLKDVRVIISKTHPFGHYIFLGFIATVSSLHLANIIVMQWFAGLNFIWDNLYKFF